MPQRLKHDDPRLTWQGVLSIERTDEWSRPWRIPFEKRDLFYPGRLVERAGMPAGVRIAFISDTDFIEGEIATSADTVNMDICCDGELCWSEKVGGRDHFRADGLPQNKKLIELWLPQFGEFRLKSLTIADEAEVEPFEDDRPKWITYGSSITQCRSAESPTQTWPGVVARKRELNLTCLGFGGECHLDIMIARAIAELPADLISMCVGINVQGGATMSIRTFRPAIIGFVYTVRDRHPDVPFIVMSPIYSPPRETTPNRVGISLVKMREEVETAVDVMRSHGDRNLYYVNGLDVFGEDLAHLLPDDLHPNAEGYKAMGLNFLKRLDEIVPRTC